MPSYSLPVGTSIIEPEIPSSVPTYVGRCTLISVDLERVNIAGKIDKHWISGIKRPQLRSIYILLVPKAGLEPARISTVDFESTASTDFATSALKRYAENVVDYTCRTPPCKRQLARTSLSAEIFSIAYSDV